MAVTSLQLIRAEIKKSTKTIPYFLRMRTFILNYRKYSSVSEFKRYLSNKEVQNPQTPYALKSTNNKFKQLVKSTNKTKGSYLFLGQLNSPNALPYRVIYLKKKKLLFTDTHFHNLLICVTVCDWRVGPYI